MRDILHWPALTLPFISPEPSFSSYSCPQFTTSFILVLIITYSNINLGLLAPFSLILILPCQDFDHTESYSHNQILNYIPRLPPPSPIYQSTEVIGMFLYPSYQLFFTFRRICHSSSSLSPPPTTSSPPHMVVTPCPIWPWFPKRQLVLALKGAAPLDGLACARRLTLTTCPPVPEQRRRPPPPAMPPPLSCAQLLVAK